MSNKTSIYPNYYDTITQVPILNYPAGTNIGHKRCYDRDMNYIKNYPANYSTSEVGSETAEYNLLYGSGGIRYINFNPFSNLKEIEFTRPVITTLGSRAWTRVSTLYTNPDDGKTLSLLMQVAKDSGYAILTYTLYYGAPGTFPSVGYQYANYDKRVSDDVSIPQINHFISNAKIYISGYTQCSSGSITLNQIDNYFALVFEIDGYYGWHDYNPVGNNVLLRISDDTEQDYGPEPEPEPPTPSDDPYNPGGYSGSGGGPNPDGTGATGTGGLHDDTSDTIPTPSLPSNIAMGSGLFTAYNPSASQLASFASALWNIQPTDINDVLRFLFGGDAFNAVIGLHLLPVSPSTGGSQNIKLGNWDTNVSAPKISSQYVQVPFGSLMLPEYWGNCIDYAPYTKIQLALPYIGIVDVDTDDVLGSNNTLTYNIDVLSGAICATLHCAKGNLNSVIYQWSGACAVSLPFSGASYNSVLGAIAGIAAAGMGFASMAAGPIGASLSAAALAGGAGAFSAGSAASIMGTMKGKVQKSGSFGANSGALGIMTPYFILTRPVQSVPASWQADKGYPSNISTQLGTVTGYTEVSEINLECSGTEAEKKEIIDLLKKGVLF